MKKIITICIVILITSCNGKNKLKTQFEGYTLSFKPNRKVQPAFKNMATVTRYILTAERNVCSANKLVATATSFIFSAFSFISSAFKFITSANRNIQTVSRFTASAFRFRASAFAVKKVTVNKKEKGHHITAVLQ